MKLDRALQSRRVPLLARDRLRAAAKSGHGAATAAFAFGLTLTAAAFLAALLQQSHRVHDELARRSNAIVASVQRELARDAALLDSLASFLVTMRGGTRSTLRTFTVELGRGVEGVALLDWAPRITPEQLKAFEEAQWVDGLPGFRVHTDGRSLQAAPEYYPVTLGLGGGARLEDVDLTPGADLSRSLPASTAIGLARTRQAPVLSQPLRLKRSDKEVAAALLLQPVFAPKPVSVDPVQASEELLGFAFALVELDGLLDAALSDLDRASVSVELLDVAASADQRAVVRREATSADRSTPLLALSGVTGFHPARQTSTIDVGMRKWAVGVAPGPRFVASLLTWTPWGLLLSGMLASSLLAAFVQAFVVRSSRYERVRRRLDKERAENLQHIDRLNEDLERERLELRRTQDNLFREKQQFRLMFNSVPAMIWYKDTKNRFLLVNEAAAASMGHTVSEIEGRPCSQILPAKAYDLYRDDLEIIQTGRPKLGVIEELHPPGGKSLWVRTDKLPEYDAMGRVVGVIVFAQDVTEQRHSLDEVQRLNTELDRRVTDRTVELRAANQEMESFAYAVAHDMRAPLRTIDGFSQLVIDEFGDRLEETGRAHLERIRSASQRMGRLIDDLLSLIRVARAEFRREAVDLSGLARQAAEELKSRNPARRVDLLIEATPIVQGDAALLLSAIQNLMDNAWKFTEGTPEARIDFGITSTSGGKTAFYVRDNGVGFDMVYADKLFGAFQRLHTREEFEGSGIGLAIVRLILRRHGGEVWAEGATGKGATFFFTLPGLQEHRV